MAEPISSTNSREPEQIWSFRGYRLSPGEFNTAMVHFYRGEITRSNTWRTRLDATTNWAVVATGAALSFAFSSPSHSHIMIPLNTLLIILFLYIEARRYRYYELWAYRVRLMETDFFGAMLAPPYRPSETWATRLVDNLLNPTFTITFWEAFGRRLRRNYQFIFILLVGAWIIKLIIHPVPIASWEEFIQRAAVGPIPGWIVIGGGLLFNLTILMIGWFTAGLHESKSEILWTDWRTLPLDFIQSAGETITGYSPWSSSRREELAYIITDRGDEISERIIHTMARGVTCLDGRGMYTGEKRSVLLVAVHPEQVQPLKRLVREVDPKAFVIIHHADEVIGQGFRAPS